MSKASINPPVVLSFSNLDPSGSGGLQADIETAASLGCHCAPVITSTCTSGTAPDCHSVPTDPTIIIEQARSVLDMMSVAAIKVGFPGSLENAEAIHSILNEFRHIPVVAQPSLCLLETSDGPNRALIDAYRSLILSCSDIASLSLYEAREIAGESDTIDTTAHAILAGGCIMALITGTGKNKKSQQNSVYNVKGLIKNYQWEQEPLSFLGASSTMSMAMAAYLAHGFEPIQVVDQAQNFTWQAMHTARDLGNGQRTPHRFFWADKNISAGTDIPAKKRTH